MEKNLITEVCLDCITRSSDCGLSIDGNNANRTNYSEQILVVDKTKKRAYNSSYLKNKHLRVNSALDCTLPTIREQPNSKAFFLGGIDVNSNSC